MRPPIQSCALFLLLGLAACASSAPRTELLFGEGSGLAAFTHADGGDARWQVAEDGSLTVAPGGGNLLTRAEYGDHRIELEFLCPRMPLELGIDRGNSGVYVQGIYEVQVLDSWQMELALNSCGAIYQISMPRVNASLPPETWQSYRIDFRAPRFGDTGERIENARMSVIHNGIQIQDDVELPNVTPGGLGPEPVARGPLMLQDHSHAVRYRNLRITRLDEHDERGWDVGLSFGAGVLVD